MKMVSYEAFACRCGAGDVVLRESYQPKTRGKLYYACPLSKPRKNYFGCEFFIWKEERVRLLISSPGASSTPSFSPGTSSTAIFFSSTFNTSNLFWGIFKKWRVLKLQALACKDKVTRGTNGNVYASETTHT
ncbi:retrotransposon protein, putative, ty1-copia subclass [Tanacetum coccineum]